MIRIAAVGDVHYDRQPRKQMRVHLEALHERADLLLIAGDLTQSGELEEAKTLAEDLTLASVPVIVVLGNHDYHQNKEKEISDLMTEKGITVLEGRSTVFKIRDFSVGVTGIKGFGGGFFGACVTDFGEPEVKSFARHARLQADILRGQLELLESDFKFVLLHFSPIEMTLLGERREIYPFLGSYLLSEAIDYVGVDGVFHGHAHMGTERGVTPGGVPVRNVAQTVIRHAYNVYQFDRPKKHEHIEGVISRAP